MYTLKVSIGQDMCYIQKTISNKMAFIVRSVRFGRCGSPVFERDALRQNTKRPPQARWSFKVGAAGFEPAAPCSQSRCANRTALHPEQNTTAVRAGFEPAVRSNTYAGLANRWFQPLTHLTITQSKQTAIADFPYFLSDCKCRKPL